MKKFWLQTLLLLSLLAVAQFLFGTYFSLGYELSLPEQKKLDTFLLEGRQTLYFGDSVVTNIAFTDTDRRTITEMVAENNPDFDVADFSRPAYSLRVFEYVTDYISRQEKKPKTIIVPVNLRYFSPEFDARPEYQFEKEKFYFTAQPSWLSAFYRPLAISRFLNMNAVSQEQFLKEPVFYEKKQIGVMTDFDNKKKFASTTPENIRAKYILKYMGTIKENDRNLTALLKTIRLAELSGIRTYVYITPVDYEGGTKYVGADFSKQLKQNVSTVCEIVQAENVECTNLSQSLLHSAFDFEAYPNEHLNEIGRNFVAKKVGEMLRRGK